MPALVVPNALQVVVSGQNLGTSWVNVHGVLASDTFLIDQSVADDIAAPFNILYDSLRGNCGFAWSVQSIEVRDLRTATSPTFDAGITPYSGTDAAQALGPQTSMVVSHRTGLRGKSYNGRTYLSGFTEAINDGDGSILAGARTTTLGFFATLDSNLATMPVVPMAHAVISRKLLEANAVTSRSVDPEWDRQDRRKRR